MNWLDKAIGGVAPGWGERRVRSRARIKAMMNYDAASKGRRTYGWKAPGTDADAAAHGSRARLRNLSRDMIRNRPFAARAQSVVTANVVGAGILFSVQSKNKSQRELVDKVLRRHLLTPAIDAYGEQDIYGLQTTVMNAVFGDGEMLVRRRVRDTRRDPGLALPFQVQLIEADQLDTTVTSHGGNQVIDGVEIGPTGKIVAYHLQRDHPGAITAGWRRRTDTERVPAADIAHIRRMDRPGQLRGVPWLAPVMMTVGELSDYQEAEILKQRMAALLAAVVSSTDDGTKFEGKGLEELAPGAVLGLEAGQEVTFTDPPTVTGYEGFIKAGLRAIAAGIGVTYEAISGDLQGTNFTSFRAGRMEMDRNVETWQGQIMVAQFCAAIAGWVREAWPLVASSLPEGGRAAKIRADSFELTWTPPRRAMVDPTKEIPAKLKAVDGKLISRQRAQRELGYDPDLIRREITEDQQKDAVEPRVEAVPDAKPGGGDGDDSETAAKAGSAGDKT